MASNDQVDVGFGKIPADNLKGNLAVGYIPLPLVSWRIINAGNTDTALVAATAAIGSGGVGGVDGDPKLIRVNAATDKALRLQWAAASVKEVLNDFMYPPDMDDNQALTVKILAAMGGATDIPIITVGFWQQGSVGAYALSADVGGATAAVTGAATALYSRSITAANLFAAPAKASLTLIPAAHGTDVLNIYGTWIEYVRKG